MKFKKTIFCLLFLSTSLAWCSDKASNRKSALPCLALTYDQQKIETLAKLSTKRNSFAPGFDNKNSCFMLHYSAKFQRGAIYRKGECIERFKISKEQFAAIENIPNGNFSNLSPLNPNINYALENPLYLAIKSENSHISYKINFLQKTKLSEVDEDGYESEAERAKNRALTAGIVGFAGGLVSGGMAVTFLLFLYKLKQLFYA